MPYIRAHKYHKAKINRTKRKNKQGYDSWGLECSTLNNGNNIKQKTNKETVDFNNTIGQMDLKNV